MGPAQMYVIAAALFVSGAILGIAGGSEGWWRVAQGVLVGAGGGLFLAVFMTNRRAKRERNERSSGDAFAQAEMRDHV